MKRIKQFSRYKKNRLFSKLKEKDLGNINYSLMLTFILVLDYFAKLDLLSSEDKYLVMHDMVYYTVSK